MIHTISLLAVTNAYAHLYFTLGSSVSTVFLCLIQVKQETDKSAAVATVVAAVDMARVREPVISAVEQTAQRTTTTATHIQPAQEQVRASRAAWALHAHSLWRTDTQTILRTAWSPTWLRFLGLSEQKVVCNTKAV